MTQQIAPCDQSVLYVYNLPPNTTEDILYAYFITYDEIMRITIQPQNRGLVAYIQFQTDYGVIKALEDSSIMISGYNVYMEKAKTQMTLFFAKMGSSMTQQQFKEGCEKFGPVEEASLIFDRETKNSKGCGFVKFVYRDDAVSCFNYHKYKKTFVVEWARSQIHRASQADRYTIFIGNLSKKQANQKIIENRFKQYGKIDKITIINKSSDNNAYAFVKYDNTLSPVEAIESENNANWDGQVITVELSENSVPVKKENSNDGNDGQLMYNKSQKYMKHFASNPQSLGSSRNSSSELSPRAPSSFSVINSSGNSPNNSFTGMSQLYTSSYNGSPHSQSPHPPYKKFNQQNNQNNQSPPTYSMYQNQHMGYQQEYQKEYQQNQFNQMNQMNQQQLHQSNSYQQPKTYQQYPLRQQASSPGITHQLNTNEPPPRALSPMQSLHLNPKSRNLRELSPYRQSSSSNSSSTSLSSQHQQSSSSVSINYQQSYKPFKRSNNPATLLREPSPQRTIQTILANDQQTYTLSTNQSSQDQSLRTERVPQKLHRQDNQMMKQYQRPEQKTNYALTTPPYYKSTSSQSSKQNLNYERNRTYNMYDDEDDEQPLRFGALDGHSSKPLHDSGKSYSNRNFSERKLYTNSSPKEQVKKTDSLPVFTFKSNESNGSLLENAIQQPVRQLRRDDDFDMESYLKKSSLLNSSDESDD